VKLDLASDNNRNVDLSYFIMRKAQVFFVCILVIHGALLVNGDIVCQDLVEEIICIEEKAGGNCDEYPWNAKCRKTCGRCDKCYDASNFITCEGELEKGNCGDIEVAHACSRTCATLSCTGNIHEIVHQHDQVR